jgi:hypothetical protein
VKEVPRKAADPGRKRPFCVEAGRLLDGWVGFSSPITSCIPLSPEVVSVTCCTSPVTVSDLALTDPRSCLITASHPQLAARGPFFLLPFTGRGRPSSDAAFGVDG